ncbi:MAG: MaoC/PaaZ C-terminal domain-containing protein [Acidimicrobiia bacterium]|nr:MaoC/PaaZ C-terminal domain-containing protein [Acidimicrobiia bacterium]
MNVEVGEAIPPFRIEQVRPEPMRTVAAIFRDPTPIHWDRESTRALGFDGRLLNQTPVNVGYVLNMLMTWAGPASVRRIKAEFPQPVLDGDSVTARGRVVAVADNDGETVAECDVWLERDDSVHHLVGRAWVAVHHDQP